MKSVFALSCAVLAAAASLHAADKRPFNVKGLYTEACSCSVPCTCALTGDMESGCDGVGAMHVTSGKYDRQDLSGLKAAFATGSDGWVRIYMQPANAKQAQAARDFLTAYFGTHGKVEDVKEAKIDITGRDGSYLVAVDDGNVMKFETKPMLGGDNKTAMSHGNLKDPLLTMVMQGTSMSGMYKDAGHEFTLEKGHNAYFNDKLNAKGEI